jgi:mono/diheme cytochrome c family protein
MKIRIASAWLVALGVVASQACAQDAQSMNDVQEGHQLADIICSNCHKVSRDQSFEPVLRPPAPSFESIAQRKDMTIDFVRTHLATTHRDISNPGGMPNPQLIDHHAQQVAAYLLSLRKLPAAAGPCSAEIVRVEMVLKQARANRQLAPSAPESTDARLHRQPTPQTVASAEIDAEKRIDDALMLARKLESEGKNAECITALEKVAIPR